MGGASWVEEGTSAFGVSLVSLTVSSSSDESKDTDTGLAGADLRRGVVVEALILDAGRGGLNVLTLGAFFVRSAGIAAVRA